MTTLIERVNTMVEKIDSANAEYILNDNSFQSKFDTAQRFEAKGDTEMVEHIVGDLQKFAEEYNEKNLTPANVQVGEGVTMHLYSDAHAGTIIKKTKLSITVQRDKATLDPNFKPEIVVGGFAGHCTNQNEQTYSYERDENGTIETFRWSKKYNRYQNKSVNVYKGRHEFYDYNF